MNKFLYFNTRLTFDSIKESFPANLSPLCFILDTNEIWFNDHFFQAGHESISISEMNNIVTVSLSEDSFNILPGSESISVSKGLGNNIIVSCNALTRVNTDSHLEWRDNKLWHADSGVLEGTYGPLNDTTNTNTIPTLNISIDKAGHITDVKLKNSTIRDYVELRKSDTENENRLLLLAERSEDLNDTNITRKSKATFNNATEVLTVPKVNITGEEDANALVINNGNVIVSNGFIEGKVKGDIEGSATPKIHISEIPNYGGASTKTYGHVMLVDEISGIPERSSDNENPLNANVQAKAASPYAVYNYFQNNKMVVKAIDYNSQLESALQREWKFGEDFTSNNSIVEISWKEY